MTNILKLGVSLTPPRAGSRVEDVGWNWTARFTSGEGQDAPALEDAVR